MTANSIGSVDRSGMDDWFTPGRFAIVLALMICASFPRELIGTGTFYLRDYAQFTYPVAFYQRDCFWRGESPLWSPMNYCGLPFLAQWNTVCLYPLTLFYLLLPLTWALGVFCLGHLFLGGMGMYFLAHHWTGNRFAAAAGGVAFAFTGLILCFLMWSSNLAALAWMPWVVLCTEKAGQEGGRSLVVAALAGAMQMLAGAPEVIAQTWGLLVALFLLECVRERRIHGRKLARVAAVVALITGLTAAQLLPFLDLLAHSHRDTGFADSTWSMPLWGWANYLVPLFGCTASVPGIYSQPQQYWVFSYYVGIGALTLAGLAVWRARQARVWLVAGVTLFCLLMALGDRGLLYPVIRKALPFLGFMRYPVKFATFPAFSLPLLAAIFVGQSLPGSNERWPQLRRQLLAFGTLAVAAVGLILGAGHLAGGDFAGTDAIRSALGRIVLLVAILGLLAALRRPDSAVRPLLLRGALLVLLWLDVPTMGSRLSPTVATGVYEPGLAQRAGTLNPVPEVGQSRALLAGDIAQNLMHLWFTNAVEHVLYDRLALNANFNLLDGVPKVVGFYSLNLRQMNDIYWLVSDPTNRPAGLLDFLAVSQINVPGRATEWMYRPTHLPWVTGGQQPVFADADQTLSALGGADFNPRNTVYLPPEARTTVTVTNASTPTVSMREFGRSRVLVDVQAAEPALIVIAQNYYHNWRASVDGRPVPLLRVNHAFQAVEVPTGRHELRLVYRDDWFRTGAGVSLITSAGCAAFWFGMRRNLHRLSPEGART